MCKKLLALCVLPALLAACAASPKFDWIKDNVTIHEKDNALAECGYQAKLNKLSSSDQAEVIPLCMRSKGYRYRQVD